MLKIRLVDKALVQNYLCATCLVLTEGLPYEHAVISGSNHYSEVEPPRQHEDRSHRPQRLQTSLTEAQEHSVIAVRKTLLLSLDDLRGVSREFLYDKAPRVALQRCLAAR